MIDRTFYLPGETPAAGDTSAMYGVRERREDGVLTSEPQAVTTPFHGIRIPVWKLKLVHPEVPRGHGVEGMMRW